MSAHAQIAPLAEQWLQRLDDARKANQLAPLSAQVREQALHVFGCSDYVARTCVRWPQLADQMAQPQPVAMHEQLRARCGDATTSEETLMLVLREFRHVCMARIAWQELCGNVALEQTVGDLSQLAEACMDVALEHLYKWHCERFGVPRDSAGHAQRLIIVAMGKLGGGELNFSSDIDLVFAFRDNGETDGAVPRSNIEFFIRLAQRLIRVLSEPTAEGFAFRVDMRLRPFGDSGPLVASGEALAHYYLTQGRDWERYAFVKARVVAGDQDAGRWLLDEVRPFVYRRYLDYTALSSLRTMKASIKREYRKRGDQFNVKLSDGGIREVEFIAQSFQLIRGGREPRLQCANLLDALTELGARGHLPADTVQQLREDYVFLRRLENAIQMLNDEQLHTVPQDSLARERIARAMAAENWSQLASQIEFHSTRVARQFADVFNMGEDEATDEQQDGELQSLWPNDLDEARACDILTAAGFRDASAVLHRLRGLRDGLNYNTLSQLARKRFDDVMPAVLASCGVSANPDETLFRILGLLQQIAGRSVYLVLLHEHPQALAQVVRLFAASPWIASFVSQHPIVLDELLDPRSLSELPDRVSQRRELEEITQSLDMDDLELRLDRVRQFQHTQILAIAAVDIYGELDVTQVSTRLTVLAEIILRDTYDLVWRELTQRYGHPTCVVDGELLYPELAVVAYGKLGSMELGYGSDLDLVFLHDSRGTQQNTDGENSIDNTTFFSRFGQKLIHYLATRTAAGILYEIDTRLRPNGNSGLLVSAFDVFSDYQFNEAWTWEHQALVRARMVIGSPAMIARFDNVRERVLARNRSLSRLRADIVGMRERMRGELAQTNAEERIKRRAGGITDIEFMVQYAVLASASDHPQLLAHTDNQHLIDALRSLGLWSDADAQLLGEVYPVLRQHAHRAALGEELDSQTEQRLASLQAQVAAAWQRLLLGP